MSIQSASAFWIVEHYRVRRHFLARVIQILGFTSKLFLKLIKRRSRTLQQLIVMMIIWSKFYKRVLSYLRIGLFNGGAFDDVSAQIFEQVAFMLVLRVQFRDLLRMKIFQKLRIITLKQKKLHQLPVQLFLSRFPCNSMLYPSNMFS